MYEWAAVFERIEVINIDGGREEKKIRTTKGGKIEALYGQDVIMGIVQGESKTGNIVQFELRQI